jgi:hypothetical protein
MTYRIVENRVFSQAIADTSATKNVPLGTIVRAVDETYGEGEFIYLLGVANTAVGSWVTYNADDYSTTLLAANAIGPVAIAMSANVASQYGWYQISGKAIGKTAGDVADNGNLYATSAGTAGSVDDTDVAGDCISCAKAASAGTGATTIEVEIHRPFVRDGIDN